MKYIWEQKDWPNFFWDKNVTDPICREIAFQLGALRGRVGVLENEESLQKELDNLLKNILHSFEIEGENLDAHSVRSSLAKRLKINSAKKLETKKSEGLADLQMDVLKKSNSKMTKSRLFGWHKLLFLESEKDVAIGKWRKKETMRIVSGRLDKPKIHFEAPPHNKIEKEMKILLEWLNNPKDNTDPFVKAGIVQYWFLTIHPFEDGNGRISRYLSELILANYNNCCIRMYSLSSTILKKRKEYYEILEKSQKGSLDITEWLRWFLNVLLKSIQDSILQIDKVIFKTRFWKKFSQLELKTEQRKILNLLLDSESEQFLEEISAGQYGKITKVSKATSTRHLSELVSFGCLQPNKSGGRSSSYKLKKF